MPYISDRRVFDADSHVMEIPNWLDEYGTKRVADACNARFYQRPGSWVKQLNATHDDPAHRAKDADEVMLRKNHDAIGSFRATDRSSALDLIGIQAQLVFPTSANVWLEELEHGDDIDLLYDTAAATNRSQLDFCASDSRMLPVCYVPIADMDRAEATAKYALEIGAKALLIPWACPKEHATSHIGLSPVWTRAEEAGVPVLFHVGVADKVLPAAHKNNGLPAETDFHGGEENFRSISCMAISHGPMQALSMLIFDGVLDRHENLKIGVIELGAAWLPSYLRQLDAVLEAFGRHEKRLQKLGLKPSEYIHRQVRVTPYPTEPVGWIIEQSGPDLCMFSTDYPHIEGGRNPYGRFENSLKDQDARTKERFYSSNFECLMGSALSN